MNNMKTINSELMAEITEKKSKFIANIYYIENEDEVAEILKKIRKKYFDAKHHCFAYRLLDNQSIIQRSSDDGEPSGTAGKPILTILEKNELVNVLVVVTRYFGGILLGTGGLVKAYTEATQNAFIKAEYLDIELGYDVNIDLSYQDIEKLKYFCKINEIKIKNEEFLEKVRLNLEISKNKLSMLLEFCNKNLNNAKTDILTEKYIKYNKN